jgi:hypothetical protein
LEPVGRGLDNACSENPVGLATIVGVVIEGDKVHAGTKPNNLAGATSSEWDRQRSSPKTPLKSARTQRDSSSSSPSIVARLRQRTRGSSLADGRSEQVLVCVPNPEHAREKRQPYQPRDPFLLRIDHRWTRFSGDGKL